MSSFNLEKTQISQAELEENKVKLSIHVDAEVFKEGLRAVYNKHKGHFNIPGFRKGKAPRKVIEQHYGRETFYEDAINNLLEPVYAYALEQTGIDAVYRPDIDLGAVDEATGLEFFAEVYVRPAVEIDGYLGLPYPKEEAEPTESEIQDTLRAEQEKNARQVSVGRPARLDDIVNINFTGYTDGVPFEGGKGDMVDLTLGSGRFIPGFEEQLIGKVTGDDVQVNVTFPEEYGHKELAGKPALFEVEIIDVKEKQFPELDDDFAQEISEFDTLDEYRADITEKMRKTKGDNLDNNKRAFLMQQLGKMITANIPEVMYDAQLDDMTDAFRRRIESQGMDFDTYLRYANMTETALRNGWKAQARMEVQSTLALGAIAAKEGFEVTDEEFNEKFGEMANLKDDALTRAVERLHPRRRVELKRAFLCDKAMDYVLANAVATDEPMPVIDAPFIGDVIDIDPMEEE
jgi:trigger factor